MNRSKNANSLFFMSVFVPLILVISGLLRLGHDRASLLPSLATMSGEKEIRRALFRAIELAASTKEPSEIAACVDYIKTGTQKLALDWPGFLKQEYDPAGYSSRDLACEIYGKLGQIIKAGEARNINDLRQLLKDLGPDDATLRWTWEEIIKFVRPQWNQRLTGPATRPILGAQNRATRRAATIDQ